MISDGTKNTGSHFASSVAPGFSARYSPSPILFFSSSWSSWSSSSSSSSSSSPATAIAFRDTMAANRAPQPARLDGKGIEYFAKRERNPTSRVTRPAVANAVRRATSSADDDDGDDDDDDGDDDDDDAEEEEEEEEEAAEEERAENEEEEEAVGYPLDPPPR